MSEFKCFFCLNDADSIAYYSKDYFQLNTRTIENPTLCCEVCFNSPRIIDQINCNRGGSEGVYRFLFTSIAKWKKKQIGYHLSKRGWEINQMANKSWRKLLFRIWYTHQPNKDNGGIVETSRSSSKVSQDESIRDTSQAGQEASHRVG